VAITFDGATKRIILDSANTTAAILWSRWVDWAVDNSEWEPAFKQVGGDDLGSGLFIPVYIFLTNGWRVRPMESSHNLIITGNLFVDGGGIPVVSPLGTFNVTVQYTVPIQAQGIATSGSIAPTASENALAVRNELTAELSHLLTLENGQGLTSTQSIMLLELYRIMGLDPTKPLVVTNNSRTIGSEIGQSIDTNQTRTIVTRI